MALPDIMKSCYLIVPKAEVNSVDIINAIYINTRLCSWYVFSDEKILIGFNQPISRNQLLTCLSGLLYTIDVIDVVGEKIMHNVMSSVTPVYFSPSLACCIHQLYPAANISIYDANVTLSSLIKLSSTRISVAAYYIPVYPIQKPAGGIMSNLLTPEIRTLAKTAIRILAKTVIQIATTAILL